MKIVTKLKVFGLLLTSLLVIAGLTFYWRVKKIETATQKNDIAHEIIHGTLKSNIISQDYVLTRTKRSAIQWKAQHDLLNKSISTFSPEDADEQTAINDIKQWQTTSLDHFTRLITITGEQESTSSATRFIGEIDINLTNRLAVDGQNIITLATKLTDISQSQANNLRHTTSLVLAITFIILGITVILGYHLLARDISIPIEKLEQGTKTIAEGYLGFQLDVGNRRDEFGSLAKSFNLMASKLKSSFAQIKQDMAKEQAIMSSIGEGVLVVDRNGKVIVKNSIAQNLLGLGREEVIGKHYSQIWKILDKAGEVVTQTSPIQKTLSTGAIISTGDYSFVKKDGTSFPVYLNVAPVHDGQVVSGAIAIFRDITKEKEIDLMKTEFITLTSHQLRTPLTAIKWIIEIILDKDSNSLTKKQTNLIKKVGESNARLIGIVNSLLNVSQIEAGKILLKPSPTDMGKLVKSVVNSYTPQIKANQQKIVLDIQPNLPKISIDERLISQVYSNLITNSVKYSPPKSSITIQVKKEAEMIVSQISDNGVGIPVDEQNKIFKSFGRASNALKIDTEGTGLGLYLAKMIIIQSGGKIWFKSEGENKGTSFWFSLPTTVG